MPIGLAKERLLEIVGGYSVSGTLARDTHKLSFLGVEYNSKEIHGGELFVAIQGEVSHGHAFVPDALSRGAALVLVEDGKLLEQAAEPERFIVVENTLSAFQKLANFWRRELEIPVLAITGSVGKTTTKEICAAILLKSGPGSYSLKSHNNHVGVPYSICRIGRDHNWAVLEMGMNHPGELSVLTKIAKPDVVVISQIAPAHIEYFDNGLEGITEAKLEIVEGLRPAGVAVLNAENQDLMKGYGRLVSKPQSRFFGMGPDVNCQVSGVVSQGFDGVEFDLRLGDEMEHVRMNSMGKQTAMNAACAALACSSLLPGLSLETIKAGLESFTAPLMRLQVKYLADGRRLIDDSYNANPTSMSSMLEIASDLKKGGLSIGLILGDMRELGSWSEFFHKEIGEQVSRLIPSYLICVGPNAALLAGPAKAAGIDAQECATPEEAGALALKKSSDVILVKASRGIGLDRAVSIVVEGAGEVLPGQVAPPEGEN